MISNYLAQAILNATLTNTANITKVKGWAALCSAFPVPETNGITEIQTPGTNGYARVDTSALWTLTDAWAANTSAITFPSPTGDWGTACAIAFMDASTSGNLLYAAKICSQAINDGDPAPTFPINSVIVGLGCGPCGC